MLNLIASLLLASGQAGSPATSAALAAQTNVHYAWAHVLRVDPVYKLVPQPQPDCVIAATPHKQATSAVDVTAPHGADVEPGDVAAGSGNSKEGTQLAADALLGVPPPATCVESIQPIMKRQRTAFDVEYRFRGEVYVARLPYDPGGRLRVRVEVRPAE